MQAFSETGYADWSRRSLVVGDAVSSGLMREHQLGALQFYLRLSHFAPRNLLRVLEHPLATLNQRIQVLAINPEFLPLIQLDNRQLALVNQFAELPRGQADVLNRLRKRQEASGGVGMASSESRLGHGESWAL